MGRSFPLAQRSERRTELGGEEFRLLPLRKVTALIGLMEINELVITTLSPASWRTADLAGKDRYGSRDRDVHGVEVVGVILPVQLCGRRPGVRQPVERDVVKHFIFCECLLGLSTAI